jgi:hypothetical protein
MSRIVPASYCLRIPQRATLEELIVLKSGGQPVNLTGYTVLASIYKDRERREKLVDLDVVYTNRATGSVKLRLDRTITRTLNQSGFWDLLVIEPDGDADYWMEGPATLDIGLTDNT